ncbi:DUF6479 family protein [Streptomyces sp. NPDC005533]|uniref:DUF6479 family protein n=1 Tax=Streptomyces sp. NPDC005533 TaxID=3364723 RepID=UPI0036AE91F9
MNNAAIWVFLLVGVAVAVFLLIAFARGRRIQARDSGPLHTDERSRPAQREPTQEEGTGAGVTEADPAPDLGSGDRSKPHQLKGYGNFGTRAASDDDR